ncbi:MAG: glucose-6-phosphate dehydrogenase (NADP(+)), partial [Armatimonadota bacterium]|nr:glucose-6-phosphate dehydrogenase (NADP(+)) [Armatimonadota bacterium]
MSIAETSTGGIIPESEATAQIKDPNILGPVLERPEDNCAFVIFGASGDLTGRKLIPALYNLYCQDLLPPGFAVIGFAITPMTDESFRESMQEWVRKSPEVLVFRRSLWNEFVTCLHYITGDFESPAGYQNLRERLDELDSDHVGSHNAVYYLATAPSFYALLCQKLGEHGFVERGSGPRGWMRVVIEKPFGHDLESARRLNESIHQTLDEDKIYRIDHYLGKETVRNILAFRFANSIMEPIWNNRYIDHVQITACEQLGVEHRGRYYEEAGCVRDMFQNHLFQLLALVAMEPPVRYDKHSVRDRKGDVLRAVVPLDCGPLEDSAVRGQYGPGMI